MRYWRKGKCTHGVRFFTQWVGKRAISSPNGKQLLLPVDVYNIECFANTLPVIKVVICEKERQERRGGLRERKEEADKGKEKGEGARGEKYQYYDMPLLYAIEL